MRVFAGLLLAGVLLGCEQAPEGGWGPVAGDARLAEGDLARLILAADGTTVEVPLGQGEVRRQQLPGRDGAGLDIDGVGAFPGSAFGEVELRAPAQRSDGARLLVSMKFSAPASADAVLDWYQAAFEARARPVQRDRLVLNGQTKTGDSWTLAMKASESESESESSEGEIRLRRQ